MTSDKSPESTSIRAPTIDLTTAERLILAHVVRELAGMAGDLRVSRVAGEILDGVAQWPREFGAPEDAFLSMIGKLQILASATVPDRDRMYARKHDGSVVEDLRGSGLNSANCLALWHCTIEQCYAHPSDECPCGRPGIRTTASDRFARLRELASRLVAAGPKASHVSASETHEIADGVHALLDERAEIEKWIATTDFERREPDGDDLIRATEKIREILERDE